MAKTLSYLYPQRAVRKKTAHHLPTKNDRVLNQAETHRQPRGGEI